MPDPHVITDRDAADRYFVRKFSAPFFAAEPWFNFDPAKPRVIRIDTAGLATNKLIKARVNELVQQMQCKYIPPTIELEIYAACGHRQPFTLLWDDMRLGSKRYKRMHVAASSPCSACKEAAQPQRSTDDLQQRLLAAQQRVRDAERRLAELTLLDAQNKLAALQQELHITSSPSSLT